MFKKNIILAPHTTFKIGGRAKYFYIAENKGNLMRAIKVAKKAKVPFFILGGGSNVLVSDEGFDGLVIKIKNQKSKIKNNRIYADAGVMLGRLVDKSIKAGLTGLEWAVGIPGTIGGAVFGNAGSQKGGSSIGDLVEKIFLLDNKSKTITVGKKWMKFKYRYSRLRDIKPGNRPIILSVVLRLEQGDHKKIRQAIAERITGRKENIPKGFSAGCVFKNPEKYPAGYLIEQCGLKGKKIGGAMISEKHANFIVNLGKARAKDVKDLINLCKEKVREKFGIELKEEIEYLGEF